MALLLSWKRTDWSKKEICLQLHYCDALYAHKLVPYLQSTSIVTVVHPGYQNNTIVTHKILKIIFIFMYLTPNVMYMYIAFKFFIWKAYNCIKFTVRLFIYQIITIFFINICAWYIHYYWSLTCNWHWVNNKKKESLMEHRLVTVHV